ncbi:MAG TPA: BREX-1 system phosphatase PglZ type B [Ktedonobacteraceae bacterium]|nr:BREX-1 system phosphatase PglZ type B [Ktedonobacteraceae bacterium]
MSKQKTFLSALVETLNQRAGSNNHGDQVAPVVLLWPDKERQFEPLIPLLRQHLPLLTLGDYNPAEHTGPAYWLRCVIDRTIADESLIPANEIPILYLPGIGYQDLRADEDTDKLLAPLVELQYRGSVWTQKKSLRDMTLVTFLTSLEVETGKDQATSHALQRALLKLAEEPVARLRAESPLRAAFFDALLNPDEARSLLLWLNDPVSFRQKSGDAGWASFCDVCVHKYEVHPVRDGQLVAAQKLGSREGNWSVIWNRFLEAPQAYPNLLDVLRRAKPDQLSLFILPGSWPQENEAAEDELRQSFLQQRDYLPQVVRQAVFALEKEHGQRRGWVWAQLGHSPLALALEHIVTLAQTSETALGGATVGDIRAAYTAWGWKVDAAVLAALASVERPEDSEAVKAVVNALYRPWLEQAASVLQKAVFAGSLAQTYPVTALPQPEAGTCLLFSDGLRYDLGQRLVSLLRSSQLTCTIDSHLVPLPSITSTAKNAIAPVAQDITGKAALGLEPLIRTSGTKMSSAVLRKLLENAGYQILQGHETGSDPTGKAWAELGAIDSYGHSHEQKLAHHVQKEIEELALRVKTLLDAGWKQVIIVTDHGWLLLPGGLPKADLPQHLTHLRKGRCAQLVDGANCTYPVAPWYWNSDVQIALAPNIHCFEAGKEYEHGGLSPQECFVPVITATNQNGTKTQPVTIKNVTWSGLRCKIELTGFVPGMKVDLRSKAGDASSSFLGDAVTPLADGRVSVLVENEDALGTSALIVVLKSDGSVSKQSATIIGGEEI